MSLPAYNKPPVNEVVCGLRFKTPDDFRIPHIGLLWNKFRDQYPNLQHAAPIAIPPEDPPTDKSTNLPLPRVWFINQGDDKLIQFQVDRFYFNWRSRGGIYPHYSNIIEDFKDVWSRTEEFFREFNLGELTPVEAELTYINYLPKGEGWNNLDDLKFVFVDFLWTQKPGRFLPNPFNLAWQTRFMFPDCPGQLVIKLNQGRKRDDGRPAFVLELNARNRETLGAKDDILKWFDAAHVWIVKGFTDITAPEIQKKIWERTDA